MNVTFNSQNSYLFPAQRSTGNALSAGNILNEQQTGKSSAQKTREVKNMIRGLDQMQAQQKENPYAVNSKDKIKDMLGMSGTSKSGKEEKVKKSSHYNYKEIANKILRAKTSVSAGQAVISAKRKVLEVKRKMAGSDGDAQELQAALAHAKRMEMAARKKKHHLELEELVVATQERDEKQDQMQEAASDMKNAMVEASEEKVAEQEDAIFEEREGMMDEITEGMDGGASEISDEAMSDLNEMIAEFGEEELKELEEEMEMLENMEVIDPHMSKEDLEDLKRKHRSAEQKAVMKANMDYIKTMIKHTLTKSSTISGISGGSASAPAVSDAAPSVDVSVGGDAAAVSGAAAMPSIDVQV